MHPYFRNDALIRFCKEKDIHVTAYSPLGAPDSPGATGATPGGVPLLEEPTVVEVARRLGKSPAQVRGLGFGSGTRKFDGTLVQGSCGSCHLV